MNTWDSQFDDYLKDESRMVGTADSVAFPTSEAEVVSSVRAADSVITVQGARTGIVAGAVPQGGLILNLSRMNQFRTSNVQRSTSNIGFEAEKRIVVEPGVTLADLRKIVEKGGMFFPPDPTEATCSIGGMVATNASGALTFYYGPTRDWVRGLRIVLADGDVISLSRGQNRAQGRSFSITTAGGRTISGKLPSYTMPDVKSAAGYYVADDMDLIDLFIGSEGTLGIVTEIELALIPKPKAVHGITIFLPNEKTAVGFVRELRGGERGKGRKGERGKGRKGERGKGRKGERGKGRWEDGMMGGREDGKNPSDPTLTIDHRSSTISPRLVAIEYFDRDAVDMLRKARQENSAFADIPVIEKEFHTGVYLEFHGESDEELGEAVIEVMELALEYGGNEDDTWYATNTRELEPIKAFRHAIPEAANLLISERKREFPDLTKLGTDMSVPDDRLEEVIAMYRSDLKAANLQSVVFGHIGNNHVHVNILPKNMEEYERGKSLYLGWAKKVVAMGGSVSAEHGIGKLKTELLAIMYGESGIAEMRALKQLFDPGMVLNPGNLF